MNKLTDSRKKEIMDILGKVYPALTSFGYKVSTAMYVDNNHICLMVQSLEGENLFFIKTKGEKATKLIRVGITNLHSKIMTSAVKNMSPESAGDEKWFFQPTKGLRFAIWYNPKIIQELLNVSRSSKNLERISLKS